ncbi:ABC transporter permease [Flavobacteriaceae bacterium F89]|uniref:ABC transporter permease n=1 Tax=Cerina litoralis TaxID=2874477 RepID=A0AAE3EWV3_9FLAO|nr:FtsX-like permease family protein [Cerina litoralis]MCG2461965.1 ABC transporter permease [Cerina litoralis]
MNFPFYIAKRYVRSKSSQNVVNIINFVTFLVIVIGAAALFIVLSGFSGLKTFSLSFSNTFDPDLKALPSTGKFFSISPKQDSELKNLSGVASYAKELEERVYLTQGEKSHVAYIKGVDANYNKVTAVDSTIFYGEWNLEQQRGVAGLGVANLLGLVIDDFRNPLMVLIPKPGTSLSQQSLSEKPYNEMPLVISGLYAIEENLDKKYVFVDLPLAQAFLEKDSTQVSGIDFKIVPGSDIKKIKGEIAGIFQDMVIVKDRRELNSALYQMLNTENMATYLIFTLVLIIALFNVVGAIIMMILDKQQNSITLFNLGTTIKELRRIYFVQGLLVTGLGGIIGVAVASLLIWSQLAFGWLKITPSLAYPVEYKLINVAVVLGTIMVLGIIASKIASSRINRKLISPSP